MQLQQVDPMEEEPLNESKGIEDNKQSGQFLNYITTLHNCPIKVGCLKEKCLSKDWIYTFYTNMRMNIRKKLNVLLK